MPGMGHNGGPAMRRSDLADALEKDMNHYLTAVDRGYYRDFGRMLFSLGPIGTQFRKVYRCLKRKRPVSEWVNADNLIVSQEATDLSTAQRVTERVWMWPREVRRYQDAGWWVDVSLGLPDENPSEFSERASQLQGTEPAATRPADKRHEIMICHTDLDLPGFEHPEGDWLPYRVTIDLRSRTVLEVRRNWREEDEMCLARQRYVMFGMVPGLKFYYLGLVHLALNQQRALTAITRILIDSGMFASFPGWLKGKTAGRAGSTNLRVMPGQVAEIDLGSANDVNKAIMRIPYGEPSAALMQIWESLSNEVKESIGALEMNIGEGRQDVPVGTMLAQVEQSTKIMAAVHKGLHQSRAEELQLLKELFEEDPSALWKFAKKPARRWEVAEELADLELVPSSDPNVPSRVHRMMQAMASVQMASPPTGMPMLYNLKEIHEEARRTLGLSTGPEIWAPPPQPGPPPPPDPKIVAAGIKAQADQLSDERKAATEAAKAQQDTQRTQAELANDQAERESRERVAMVEQETERERMVAQAYQHGASVASDLHQHHTQMAHDARKQAADWLAPAAGAAVPPGPEGSAPEGAP